MINHIVEICTDTYKSVENAVTGGAFRIELCSALEVGGLTPSYGLVKSASESKKIKVNVLIRPRPGNFVYSDEEFDIMCQDIEILKTLSINGIVSGVLTKNGEIDILRTKKLVDISRPLEFTFHRAFDNCKNPESAIIDIIETGANRILTSGGKPNVTKGMDTILKLHKEHGQRISIMPGGGINANNALKFIKGGIKEIHLSAGLFESETSFSNKELGGMGHLTQNNQLGYKFSNPEIIKEIVRL